MADNPADNGPPPPCSSPMGERFAVLETIAAETRTGIFELRAETRDLRTELQALRREAVAEFRAVRQDFAAAMRAMRQDMMAGFAELRRVHDRDFRLTWVGMLAGAIGLLYLIAKIAHWV